MDPSEFFDLSSLDDDPLVEDMFEEPTAELTLKCGCGTGLSIAGEYHADYCALKEAITAKARNP